MHGDDATAGGVRRCARMAEATSHPVNKAAAHTKRRRWPYVLGIIVLAIVIVAVLFRWDWLLPLVESRASAALGRRVTAQHMHVQLGRVTRITFDDVHIANPDGWPGGGDFATAQHLAVSVNAAALIRKRQVIVPVIGLDHPNVDAVQLADGKSNWDLGTSSKSGSKGGGLSPKIGEVQIADGTAHFVDPHLKADFQLAYNTLNEHGAQPGAEAKLHATAKGTYAAQPITGEFTGGTLLSLRDVNHPYPINLQVANGPTHVSLAGTVQDPLSFKGADIKLVLEGPNMELLYPLTGIPVPPTPAYRIAGNIDYDTGSVRFTHAEGKIGRSDIGGDLAVTTAGKPVLTATLASHQVDLQDLAGFIGSTPKSKDEPGATPQERKEAVRAEASPKLIPNTPVSLPKLNALDVHLHYKVEHILGRGQPLDNMVADFDIVDGAVRLHPLSFGIGGGQVTSQIALDEDKGGVHARADVSFQRIPLDKLVSATGAGRGAGVIGGSAVVDGTGKSLAAILAHGNGEVKLYMARGGDLSALLVDLSGLEFGNALLSAIGIPKRAQIECLIADAKMQDGVVRPEPLLLDTSDAVVNVSGDVNLLTEVLGLQIKTKPKHFSIGSLPAPINIAGTFKDPSIRPDATVMAERAGAAVALGVLLTPLAALIPTIQLGTSDAGACSGLTRVEAPVHLPPAAPTRHEPARHLPVRRR